MDDQGLAAVLAAMAKHQASLRVLLESFPPGLLTVPPAEGKWSAVENVRHMLFVEQAHLGRFVPGGLGFSPMGLTPGGLQGRKPFAAVGTDPVTEVARIFDEWRRVHAAATERIDLSHPGVADRLPRLLRHQQTHGTLAARAARKAAKEVHGRPRLAN